MRCRGVWSFSPRPSRSLASDSWGDRNESRGRAEALTSVTSSTAPASAPVSQEVQATSAAGADVSMGVASRQQEHFQVPGRSWRRCHWRVWTSTRVFTAGSGRCASKGAGSISVGQGSQGRRHRGARRVKRRTLTQWNWPLHRAGLAAPLRLFQCRSGGDTEAPANAPHCECKCVRTSTGPIRVGSGIPRRAPWHSVPANCPTRRL